MYYHSTLNSKSLNKKFISTHRATFLQQEGCSDGEKQKSFKLNPKNDLTLLQTSHRTNSKAIKIFLHLQDALRFCTRGLRANGDNYKLQNSLCCNSSPTLRTIVKSKQPKKKYLHHKALLLHRKLQAHRDVDNKAISYFDFKK